MKPARFRYAAPASAAEALELLREHGAEARPLAGGQSLVPMMNFRLLAPALLVDLNRLADWSFIEARDGHLAIGAMTRQSAVEDSALVASHCPLLAEAIGFVAHRQIRNRGTVGGSLAMAYPGAEIPLVVATLDGVLLLRSAEGERRVPAQAFFKGPLETALEPEELIAAVELPLPPPGTATAFLEVARRHGDFALAAAAVALRLDAQGRIAAGRIGVSGATAIPVRLAGAEAGLPGQAPAAEIFAAAAARAAAEIEPLSDAEYSAAYRRELVAAVVRRALILAAERAGGSHAA
jgi:carbon-monoxide dehydrogenase medium subunit